jgi:uncharacterized membrane-anchored protein
MRHGGRNPTQQGQIPSPPLSTSSASCWRLLWVLNRAGGADYRIMTSDRPPARRATWNKVAEVTIYLGVIKILSTTVGDTLADYINETLGFGLVTTTSLLSAARAIVVVAQFRLNSYVPGGYWPAAVLISVVGTQVTDNPTDGHHVPSALSTSISTVTPAVVLGVWYAREQTQSIHPIVTTPRELFRRADRSHGLRPRHRRR